VDLAVGGPLGLEDRLAGAAGDELGFEQGAVRGEPGGEELRPVPRHFRVVPREPEQPRAVGAEAGMREEVVPRYEDLPGVAGGAGILRSSPRSPRAGAGIAGVRVSRQRDGDDLVHPHRVDLRPPVVFPHADETPAGFVQDEIGVAQGGRGYAVARLRRLRRDRPRLPARSLEIEALIGEVDEDHALAADEIGAAAVLVDARADADVARRQLLDPIRGAAHENAAPALGGPAFQPVEGSAARRQASEPETGGRDAAGRDRRGPGSVGSGRHD